MSGQQVCRDTWPEPTASRGEAPVDPATARQAEVGRPAQAAARRPLSRRRTSGRGQVRWIMATTSRHRGGDPGRSSSAAAGRRLTWTGVDTTPGRRR